MKQRNNKKSKAIIKKQKTVKKDKQKKVVRKTKEKKKDSFSSGRIERILNQSHPDDLYITLKLLSDDEASKLLIYFRKHRSKLHKKKELTKVIADSKNKIELLNNVKEHLVNLLKKEYEELKQQASTLRKKGIDLLIEDLKLMKIPSKIRLFEATEDKKDFYSVRQMLDNIKREIDVKKN